MLTPGFVPFYPAERLWCDAQIRCYLSLRNVLFDIRKMQDQFFISLCSRKVLHIASSLATVLIVSVHDDTVNEVRFRKGLKQMKYALMGNTKQFRGGSQLNELLRRNLFEETPCRYHDLAGFPKPVNLLFSSYVRI